MSWDDLRKKEGVQCPARRGTFQWEPERGNGSTLNYSPCYSRLTQGDEQCGYDSLALHGFIISQTWGDHQGAGVCEFIWVRDFPLTLQTSVC